MNISTAHIEPADKTTARKKNLSILSSMMQSTSVFTNFLCSNTTPDERAHLVNWIVEIHTSTSASPSVLFSTVRLLDYYCYCVATTAPLFSLQKLALLATTCMQIQSKFCENSIMDIPLICKDYLHGNSSEEEVLDTETEILIATNFKLCLPTEYIYVSLYRSLLELEILFTVEEIRRIEILLRINIHSYKLAQCDQSLVAAATIYTSKKTLTALELISAVSSHSRDSILRMGQLILEEENYMICTFG